MNASRQPTTANPKTKDATQGDAPHNPNNSLLFTSKPFFEDGPHISHIEIVFLILAFLLLRGRCIACIATASRQRNVVWTVVSATTTATAAVVTIVVFFLGHDFLLHRG